MTTAPLHPLRVWRVGAGLTVAQAAQKLGVTRQTWHAYEANRRPPLPSVMDRLLVLTDGAVQPNDFYPAATARLQRAA